MPESVFKEAPGVAPRGRGHWQSARYRMARPARKEWTMPVRLVITTYAKPGKGTALAQAMAERCRAAQQEPGCQQFEVFQSALDPDKLVVLELWADQAALDVHAQVNASQPPNALIAALRADDVRPREDYVYNRTR